MSAGDSLNPAQFSLVTEQHHPTKGRVVKRQKFGTYEEAHTAGQALDPATAGHVYPNVSDGAWSKMRGEYERGLFSGPNRYGVIINHKPST